MQAPLHHSTWRSFSISNTLLSNYIRNITFIWFWNFALGASYSFISRWEKDFQKSKQGILVLRLFWYSNTSIVRTFCIEIWNLKTSLLTLMETLRYQTLAFHVKISQPLCFQIPSVDHLSTSVQKCFWVACIPDWLTSISTELFSTKCWQVFLQITQRIKNWCTNR